MNSKVLQQRTLHSRAAGILKLSRWKEHILFTVPVTLLGVNMAADQHAVTLDWHILTVVAANILAVTCAFMINDIEDAPDDAGDPARAARNPVTMNEISRREGWVATHVIALLSLALYAWVSTGAFVIGALTIVLSYLYSWRAVRLKARPLVDVLSHVLMLAGLLFLAGYYAYDDQPGNVWLVALGVALVSVYGQLYNQVRDYDMDRAAGLHNTASILGPVWMRYTMYGSIGLAVLCLLITIFLGLWPLWLILVPVIMSPLLFFYRPQNDMRGTEAIDLSGRIQLGFMFIANAAVLIWLIANLLD
ncbi:MAG TPA: prenyltransferase [Aggregatilineaceae bacterium]|nr:prenyltransferase [Aggregatilineaceae bacterium]